MKKLYSIDKNTNLEDQNGSANDSKSFIYTESKAKGRILIMAADDVFLAVHHSAMHIALNRLTECKF